MIIGELKATRAAEQSVYNYDWEPEHFLMLLVALDWKAKQDSPLLDPAMTRIGISRKPHPKVDNSTQLCYVFETQNAIM